MRLEKNIYVASTFLAMLYLVRQFSGEFNGFHFIIMLHNLHMHYTHFQCSKCFKLKINYATISTYRSIFYFAF